MRKAAFIAIWIALWALCAWAIGSSILLASPWETACMLAQSLLEPHFWLAIALTLLHVAAGALIACALGCGLAIAAWRWPLFGEFIQPAIQFIKSAPIVCFVVLLLVWFGSTYVDLAAVALAVIPVFFFSTFQACQQRDQKLAQMLSVFRVAHGKRWGFFEWPTLRPFFLQASRNAAGLSWKSGVTAEMIGLTFASIGQQVYLSKLTLDTASLLMWMFVIVVLGWLCEKLTVALINAVDRALRSTSTTSNDCTPADVPIAPASFEMQHVSMAFDTALLSDYSCRFDAGSRTCIMAPTGTGKTTLLNLLLGFIEPDQGLVARESPATETNGAHHRSPGSSPRTSVVFQETRLLPELSATQNVALAAGVSESAARELICQLIAPEYADALPDQLSGGMKRCVEICRALAAPSASLIMDEPFAGMDAHTKARAMDLIKANLRGRTLIVATHDESDAAALDSQILRLG